jgi:ribosomal protein S16
MRLGSNKKPFYRIVAADARSPRDGKFLEILGSYDPRKTPHLLDVNTERVKNWLANGAKPTNRVEKLLSKLMQWWLWLLGLSLETNSAIKQEVIEMDKLKELVIHIAQSLVDFPEQVEVKEVAGEQTAVLELKVAQEDLGKIIGKQGKTAKAIRTILGAAAAKLRKRAVLEILE